MSSFLQECVEDLIEKKVDLLNTTIIVPSKRMGLFIQKHFAEIQPNGFYPNIATPNELLTHFSSSKLIQGNLSSLFLYRAYTEISKEPLVLSDFLKWSNALVRDFNEIDLYMLDTKDFFGYLHDVKRIETWNVDGSPPTDMQKKYLQFWEEMEELYKAYRKLLTSHDYGYSGMIYRQLAENKLEWPSIYQNQKFVFIGFNAISKSEAQFFNKLITQSDGLVYCDGDEYYVSNKIQEAGLHLRKNPLKNVVSSWSDQLKNEPKTIHIYNVPQNISQAKLMAKVFTKRNEKTALIFNDESLLIPFLSGLPENDIPMNVSMGLPVKQTPIFSFLQLLFGIQLDYQSFGKNGIYHQSFESILRQDLFLSITDLKSEQIDQIISDIAINNKVYLDAGEIKLGQHHDLLQRILFNPWSAEGPVVVELLQEWAILLNGLELDEWHQEQLQHLIELLQNVRQVIDLSEVTLDKKSLIWLMNKMLINEKIDLLGEPLQGIQVLGMLEARGLDFDEVVMASVNEEVIPAPKNNQTVIPNDIKMMFGLPSHQDRDAVFAYYFYRAIQRAKKVHLIYHTETGGVKSGERSRFITQIEHELPLANPNVKIHHHTISIPFEGVSKEFRQIEKGELYQDQVKTWLERKVSPSALNTYLSCPMDFYYSYVLGLRELEEVDEAISASAFGTVIHEVLEELYKPYISELLSADIIKKMKLEVVPRLKAAYQKFYPERHIQVGKNLLAFEVAKNYIIRFLDSEIERLGLNKYIKVVDLEAELATIFPLQGNQVRFFGVADRLEEDENGIRLIDYKSGKVEPKDVKVKSIEELRDKPKAFQLFFYAWLYFKQNQVIPNEVGNISFRKLKSGFIPLMIENSTQITENMMEEFEGLLDEIVAEINDPERIIVHNEKSLYCDYCDANEKG